MNQKNVFQKGTKVVAFLLVSTLSLNSCSKDAVKSTNIQESEVVEAVDNTLSSDTNGMAKSINTAVVYADNQNLYTTAPKLNCGQLYPDSFAENYSSTNYSYNYSVNCNYQLNCNTDGSAQSFNYQANRSGNYDTLKMSSNDKVVAQWSISDLSSSNTNTTFNGSYVQTGTQVSKVKNQNTFSSTLTYSLSNIAVNKKTHRIVSGSATVTFTGVSSTGDQYPYNGTITFNGNDTATLVINGTTYMITL